MVSRTTTRLATTTPPQEARLLVLYGPDRGLTVPLPAVGLVVGASDACDVVLKDPAVSARHAAIRRVGTGFEVRDMGSKNGTFYDGAALEKAVVPPGATLKIGNSLVLLSPEEEHLSLPPSSASRFGELVGDSLPMRRAYAVLERVSAGRASVLILGESGTGKEVCARAIHDASPRSGGPFVVFDSSAASETLLESELFGHVRGAFTGADRDRVGAFAAADGGTLFLDEIGELPLRLQPKLLRMLELGEVKPVGGTKPQRFDVRVVAATHRDLGEEVSRGTFRGDVFFRLAVVEVHLPPLRDRPDDIAELTRAFLAREGAPTDGIEGPNLERLRCYGWPGNVRELRNVLARAVALSSPGTHFADLPILLGTAAASPQAPSVSADRPFLDAKAELVEGFERAYLRDLLARHGDNLAHAARVAEVERKHLYRLLDKHGLRRVSASDVE
jgi:DNA-binding NtrC family response regulator